MSIVYSSDRHYKAMTDKLRSVLGDSKYKPSEIPQGILACRDMIDVLDNTSRSIIFYGKDSMMVGGMVDGIFAYSTMTSFTVPEYITKLPNNAFYESRIQNIELHDGITSIGSNCFYQCSYLTSISLPKNLSYIGDGAFYFADISGKLILPDSVTFIGDGAFDVCDISSLEIPRNAVLEMKYSTSYFKMSNCKYLVALILRKDDAIHANNYDGSNMFYNTPIKSGTGYIYVPASLLEEYKTAKGWKNHASQFRTLEEYTIDGTVTGAFDYEKIGL